MPDRLLRFCLLIAPAVLLLCLFSSPALGGEDEALLDSLLSAAGVEPSLQEIFDSLGYDIDVVNDELGWIQFESTSGANVAVLLDQLSSSQYSAYAGWYDAADSTKKVMLFGPANQANDSIAFSTPGTDYMGFYFIPGISGGYTWYMNPAYNRDGFAHAKVFATKQNDNEYIIAFEDLKNGGDLDFNDLIIKVRFEQGAEAPVIELPEDMFFEACTPGLVCFDIHAYGSNPLGDPLTVRMVRGPGHFDPVTGPSPIDATHCFVPSSESSVYTFVFSVTDNLGMVDYDTMMVDYNVNQAPTLVVPDDFEVGICSTETVCFTVSADDPDGDEVVFQLLDGPGSIDPMTGEVCFVPIDEDSVAYRFVIRAADSCCAQREEDCAGEPLCPPQCPVDTVVVTVHLNRDPTIILMSVDTVYWCELGDSVCLAVEVYDPDVGQDLIIEQLEGPAGALNIEEGRFCFLPASAGTFDFTFRVVDPCGAADTAETEIVIIVNQAPVVTLPDDFAQSLCDPSEICFPVTIEDDGEVVVTVSPIGYYDNGKVCFTAAKDTTYCINVRATDTCEVYDEDQICITVSINKPPYISLGPDRDEFICEPGDTVCFDYTVSDPDGEIPVVSIFSGQGWVRNGKICFVPQSPGLHYFVVRATDKCGDFMADDIAINVKINTRPELYAHNDTTILLCDPAEICLGNSAFDADSADHLVFEAISGIDVLFPASGTVCFTPLSTGSYQLVLRVVDDCGAFDQDTINVDVILNGPPSIVGTNQLVEVYYCDVPTDPGMRCFYGLEVSDADPGDDLTVTKISGPGTFYDFELKTCFTPAQVDSTYEFCYRVTDVCGLYDEVCIDVQVVFADSCDSYDTSLCLTVSIEETDPCVYNSSDIILNVNVDTQEPIGGFNLLIEHDVTAFTFIRATPGPALAGWEYFTYRAGPTGNCGGPCPDGLYRYVAIADINNGAAHPPPDALYPSGSIIQIAFRVTSDVNFGGYFMPVKFFWVDCGDNAFSSVGGDTLFIDKLISNYTGVIWDEFDDVNYPEDSRPRNVGAPDWCAVGGDKVGPVRCVDFYNGGICIIHPDSIDLRGDINLNGLAYEIADAVLFTNYFILGMGVFTINVQGQIAATDVNADGMTLTVGDLVYLVRIITGDAQPIHKLSPYAEHLDFAMRKTGERFELMSQSSARIGAGFMIFEFDPLEGTPGPPVLSADASNMDIMYSIKDGTMRVLVYSYDTQGIDPGKNSIVTIDFAGEGTLDLVHCEFSDYHGNQLRVNQRAAATMPERFTLTQNYPNPFNPETEFDLNLPYASQWKVEIFNVQGQIVHSTAGYSEAGVVNVRWDGTDITGRKAASGIYFYRATAGDYSETKKMVLVK